MTYSVVRMHHQLIQHPTRFLWGRVFEFPEENSKWHSSWNVRIRHRDDLFGGSGCINNIFINTQVDFCEGLPLNIFSEENPKLKWLSSRNENPTHRSTDDLFGDPDAASPTTTSTQPSTLNKIFLLVRVHPHRHPHFRIFCLQKIRNGSRTPPAVLRAGESVAEQFPTLLRRGAIGLEPTQFLRRRLLLRLKLKLLRSLIQLQRCGGDGGATLRTRGCSFHQHHGPLHPAPRPRTTATDRWLGWHAWQRVRQERDRGPTCCSLRILSLHP